MREFSACAIISYVSLSFSLSLANSYLVRMSNRSRYQDTMFDAFIIESETEEKEGEKEEKKREGKKSSQRVRIFNQWRY